MTTTVYRSCLRAGWIVQTELSEPFGIDQAALATVCCHCQGRLALITPESIVVSAESFVQEGNIPLVIDDITSGEQADEIFVGLSNESWMPVRLTLIRALADVAPHD